MKQRVKKHKHQWRKVGATYSKADGLKTAKRRCIVCGVEEAVK